MNMMSEPLTFVRGLKSRSSVCRRRCPHKEHYWSRRQRWQSWARKRYSTHTPLSSKT
uniref:Alternative protein IL20RA n=1 Tax=Homo sapiens TaxID=9606 RepID=L8E9L9_HUMAN|nr:alternative protein IL20RA [Homo sapiens]